ncbi:class I adenylate-forming enzyme family protein [Methylobacterium nodulans]|uniref:3-methylmercaptopropionyl-CoA ligase n=1 Tax=Methylobacterium nodulans (strain LMG 21967 / CNCM I-2342 / ORS 2060) TaxID=460265 RepID=B8IXF7_METNO|nr:AMP-binding protein [Methylobacterium nodulans]ACL63198.1 AMP-dependent synthetase and ligase [Methylobacterium nodulans ORS 2060]
MAEEAPGRPEASSHLETWAALLLAAHANFAGQVAVVRPEGAWSYADVLGAASRCAGRLSGLGVTRGARVVIALDNRPETVVIERALALWGFVRVALSPRLHPEEIDFIAADCEAAVVICEAAVAGALRCEATVVSAEPHPAATLSLDALMAEATAPALPAIGPDDLASLMYTSGTTGRPKGAMNTHRNWHAMATRMASILPPIGPGDVLLHVAPMSHFSGSVASAYAANGAAIATLRRFDPARAVAVARQIGATCMPLVPTMVLDLIAGRDEGPLLPSLKVLPYGGSSIAADALVRARAVLGDTLLQVYGMSEALIPVTALATTEHRAGDGERARLSSAGSPVPGAAVEVCAPPGEVGEIRVRGPNVMIGYWNNPDQTREVLDAEGWYASGDLGRQDPSGRIEIVGRRRDVIITGGFNVYPAEVERVIAAVPGVAEAAVIGAPHARWIETVVAVVVREAGAQVGADQLLAACRDHLAAYKKPTEIRFVPALPRISTGKVDKRRLRELYLAGAYAP